MIVWRFIQDYVIRFIMCQLGLVRPTVVILLRHADIDLPASSDDPSLNQPGRGRAQQLVHVLGDAEVAAIFASTFQRTQQTAQPLATHRGISVQVWTSSAQNLAREILDRHRGETVVVVGHSNTVPEIMSALGVTWNGTIAQADFDNLFWATIPCRGRRTVHRLHYGEAT